MIASKAKSPVKTYNTHGIPGCVSRHLSRKNGSVIAMYRNDQADIKSPRPWSVRCEDHCESIGCRSMREAYERCADPAAWCKGCAGTTAALPTVNLQI